MSQHFDIRRSSGNVGDTCDRAVHNLERGGNSKPHEKVDKWVVHSDTISAVFFANFNQTSNTFRLSSTLGHSQT
jgi:hypothetical protein